MRTCRECKNEFPVKQGSNKTLCPGCLSVKYKQNSKMRATRLIGSKMVDSNGYVHVYTQDGWIPEHRLVLAEKLGRSLVKGESAHHINGIRGDNRPENLELWVGPIRPGVRASDLRCRHCNKLWSDPLEGR